MYILSNSLYKSDINFYRKWQKDLWTSELLKDDITDNQQSFVYHLKYYWPYVLKGEWKKSIEAYQESKNDQETVEAPPQKWQKRNSLGNSTVTTKHNNM